MRHDHKGFGSRDSLNMFMEEMSEIPLLTREDEVRLGRAAQAGDERAARDLAAANLRFAVSIAREYLGYGIPLKDLIQEANMGLVRAAAKFDPDHGVRFCTYAVHWVRAMIGAYVIKNWSIVKLGTTQAQRTLFFRMGLVRARLEEAADDLEALEAIASELKVPAGAVSMMHDRMRARDGSLDAPVREDASNISFVDITPDPRPSPEARYEVAERRHRVAQNVQRAVRRIADPRLRYIIDNRLLADEPLTLAEIGDRMGISRERVRQLETKAKDRLRTELSSLREDAAM